MKLGLFVTGTDTGVGKTLISAALVHGFASRGLATAGMKPVASGCRREQGRLLSDDVALLRDAASVVLPYEVSNPYAFEPPLAPHLAAQQAGQAIEFSRIRQAFRQAAEAVEVLVVEGVGGFRVPLNATQDTADLAAALGLPVVLVVGLRLGCLSHALLSVEAIQARGLMLAGWVANGIDPAMALPEENLATLRTLIPAPCLGYVPFQPEPRVESVAERLEYGRFLPLRKGCVILDE